MYCYIWPDWGLVLLKADRGDDMNEAIPEATHSSHLASPGLWAYVLLRIGLGVWRDPCLAYCPKVFNCSIFPI